MRSREEQAIKEAVRSRDGYRCSECGLSQADHLQRYGRKLHVHRIVPGSEYGVHDGCVTLCVPCHAEKKQGCGYGLASVKIDDQVLPVAKAAAALAGQAVQDFISDVINEASAKSIGRKPLKRRPVKRPKSDG